MKYFVILLLLLVPTQVFADKDTYVKGSLGITMIEDMDIFYNGKDYDGIGYGNMGTIESDYGLSFGGAIGKSFASGFDIELEYANKDSDIDKFKGDPLAIARVCGCDGSTEVILNPGDANLNGTIEIETLMVNGIYNFNNSTFFTPYIGVGVGVAWITPKEFFYAEKTENFAYQFLAGVDVAFYDDISVLAGYRYLSAGQLSRHNVFETDDGAFWGESTADIDSHSVELSVKYHF